MSRREWTLRQTCEEPGCPEVAHYRYETRRDMIGSYEAKRKYRCVRHTRMSEVLSMQNMATEAVLTSERSVAGSEKLFWGGSSGFLHGPGFKAFADDFPPGTKLIVTARIELPASDSADNASHGTNGLDPAVRSEPS